MRFAVSVAEWPGMPHDRPASTAGPSITEAPRPAGGLNGLSPRGRLDDSMSSSVHSTPFLFPGADSEITSLSLATSPSAEDCETAVPDGAAPFPDLVNPGAPPPAKLPVGNP